jgi:molybdopterin synthase sulfur carrier subunit
MEVKVYATLRLKIGQPTIDVDVEPGETVRSAISRVLAQHPELSPDILDENSELVRHVHVFLGGHNVRLLRGLETPIEQDQRLDIFPPVGGGRYQRAGMVTQAVRVATTSVGTS